MALYNFQINIKLYFFGLFISNGKKIKCSNVLIKNEYAYYGALNNKRKKQFVIRVLLFVKYIKFSSSNDFVLDLEKKVLIASAFAQMSFGLKFYWFQFFKEICIVSRSYSYKHIGELFDGDVNLITKKINMSWPAVEKGFKIGDDALNLCIHELGHAMYFENLKRPTIDKYFSKEELSKWKELALKKIDKIDLQQNVLLRDYAGANLMEFFSVSLETFFEKPAQFKDKEPILFNYMVQILNQNPLNTKDPFILEI